MAETARDPRKGALRRRLSVCAAVFAVLSLVGAAACIIADPPRDLPNPPPGRPTILRDRLVPPNTSVLGVFPDKFIADVEVDPTLPVEWRLFVDYNPFDPLGGLVGSHTVQADPGALDAGVRELEASPDDTTYEPSRSQCHVIEMLVAFAYSSSPIASSVHTFDSRGGDSVVWFYSPTGDLSGCPIYDAGGVDGSAFPAATDASTIIPGDEEGE
jgi:hypothetical protein